jgi:outer membrane lipoprotein-sorting protein
MIQANQHNNVESSDLLVNSAAGLKIQTERPTALSRIPGRPSLRPGVRLAGRMTDVGFEDEQWLIDSNGKFIQTTELLYRIAEHANGDNTLEEIAQKVTDSTAWIVEAADVQHLIDSKLAPLRLLSVETATGAVADTKADKQTSAALSVNLRLRALSPRHIEPITKVFQIFCNLPAALCVLVVAGWIHWWLYAIHGVAGSIRDAVYTPGGLLVVFAAIFVGAVFHEFGHASVLRSQGGKVRSMGIGLYLMYPAFYTDVSDGYRLGRWARVFTDLGGIYFHLVFVIGMFGLFRLTGREFLLFAILMIDLEIVSQFIPLARLDGYWLLADLSGVPDFFSLMAPFVRSLLPGLPEALDCSRLPTLRRWVRVVFAVYIVGAVPLLAYLFFLMLRGLPTFLSQSWDALQAQQHVLFQISIRTDYWIVVLLLIQIALLCMTMLATIYFLWLVIKKAVSVSWHWARDDSRKKVAFALATGCVSVFLAVTWSPTRMLSALHLRPNMAETLLDETKTATKHLDSLQADVEGSLGADRFTATIVLKRPNRAKVDVTGTKGLGRMLIVSDGTILQTYYPDDNRYVKVSPGRSGENVQAFIIEQVDNFFRPEQIGKGGDAKYAGLQTINGTTYEVVTNELRGKPKEEVQYYISRADKLIHRIVVTDDSGRVQTSSTLTNLETNVNVDEVGFKLVVPTTAEPVQFPAGVKLPVQE